MAGKPKPQPQSDDDELAQAIRDSARQIWQAGLGAFVKAQEEGGAGFAQLVRKGTALQRRAERRSEDEQGKHATNPWDALEKVFEERVARSLQTLGVPTAEDVRILQARIEELEKTIDALAERAAPAKERPGGHGRATR